jgi:hypothetical protein
MESHSDISKSGESNDNRETQANGFQGSYSNTSTGHAESREAYAISLQKSCSEVVQRIRTSTMLVNTEWASPLTAAPNAIAIMAICLKTAAASEVADLQMTELNVKDIKGNIIGTLPY